jgi:hypothetical protein
MAHPDQEKCRLCSKLDSQEAQQRHGPEGDGCWNPKVGHNRRSYYRHRGVRNHVRKQRRRGQQTEPLSSEPGVSGVVRVATLKVLAPAVPAAVVHWYRMTKDSPLHALGAELWVGNDRVAKIEPVSPCRSYPPTVGYARCNGSATVRAANRKQKSSIQEEGSGVGEVDENALLNYKELGFTTETRGHRVLGLVLCHPNEHSQNLLDRGQRIIGEINSNR